MHQPPQHEPDNYETPLIGALRCIFQATTQVSCDASTHTSLLIVLTDMRAGRQCHAIIVLHLASLFLLLFCYSVVPFLIVIRLQRFFHVSCGSN